MRVAIVYDRVNKWGGAERVLLTLHKMFPHAPLYTSVYSPEHAEWADAFPKIHTSFLQHIPHARTNHEYYATLMPLAFEAFDFTGYDLVISVTSEAAKGIITNGNTKHICYLLTPTRYLWSGYEQYFDISIKKAISKFPVAYLKSWDKRAAKRPDIIISISKEVAKRVKEFYGTDSEVIYPPANIPKKAAKPKKKNYYLVVSRLVPYKKVDLVVHVFNKLGKKLVIIGEGRQENKLKEVAKNNIKFVSRLSEEELANYYLNSRALVFPQIEDFGLVAVEAQSYGTPVIAYNAGGARETVIDGKTGIFFEKQRENSIIRAIEKFEKLKFDRSEVIANSTRFSEERFQKEFLDLTKKYV